MCVGDGRCGCKDEVNKKLGTYLTVTWELGMDLMGQPREMLKSSLKVPSVGSHPFLPPAALGA